MNIGENRKLHSDFYNLVTFIAQNTVQYSQPIFIKQTKQGTVAYRFGIKSFLSVPLMLHEGPIGSIILMAKYRSFTNATLKLIITIASQVSSTIEHL